MKTAKRAQGIADSATLAITSKTKKMAKEGIDVVNLAAGEPDFDTPVHIKEAAVKAINEGFTKYTPSSGMPELRDAVSRKFKKDNSLDYSPSQIVVSNGAKHSLNNVFQVLCEAGDEVIMPSPYWLSYPAMVRMAEAKPVILQTKASDKFKLTEKGLAGKITKNTRCLILNSPSNPAGCVYTEKELAMIAALAVKHRFYVISDEIYEKLIYDEERHVSIASLYKDIYELTVTVNGVSKSYSMTGWRIGYAAGPVEVMNAISSMQSHAASNPSSISQKAALAALSGSQECIETMRLEFQKRRDLMVSGLNRIGKVSCVKPEGACNVRYLEARTRLRRGCDKASGRVEGRSYTRRAVRRR
jgi:aspartate aminotransferase